MLILHFELRQRWVDLLPTSQHKKCKRESGFIVPSRRGLCILKSGWSTPKEIIQFALKRLLDKP